MSTILLSYKIVMHIFSFDLQLQSNFKQQQLNQC